MKSDNTTKGIILSIAASFCGSAVPIATKIAAKYLTSQRILFMRMFIAFIILSLLMKFLLKTKMKITKRSLLISLFGSLNFIFFIFGINFMPAVYSPVFYSMVPIEATVLAFLLYKDKPNVIKFVGIIIGLVGALLILATRPNNGTSQGEASLLGIILVGLASLSIATYSLLISKSKNLPSAYSISLQSILLTLVMATPVMLLDVSNNPLKDVDIYAPELFISIFVMSFLGTIMQYILYQKGIQKIGISSNVVFFYAQPVFVVIMATIFLGESIQLVYVAGILMVLFGSSLNMGVFDKFFSKN
jgi:drug/metabolite transporter (DMT)-like permease